MEDTAIKRAAALLEQEFGSDWLTIAQQLGTENLRQRVGKELTSFMAFPDRGNGGDSKWRGNCSPEVVSSVLRYVLDAKRYYGKDTSQFTLLDPMSGSGTSKAAADRLGIKSILYCTKSESTECRTLYAFWLFYLRQMLHVNRNYKGYILSFITPAFFMQRERRLCRFPRTSMTNTA